MKRLLKMDVIMVGLVYPIGLVMEKNPKLHFGTMDAKVEANATMRSLLNLMITKLEKYSESERLDVRLVSANKEPLRLSTRGDNTWVVLLMMKERPADMKRAVRICKKSMSTLEEILKKNQLGGRASYEFVWQVTE